MQEFLLVVNHCSLILKFLLCSLLYNSTRIGITDGVKILSHLQEMQAVKFLNARTMIMYYFGLHWETISAKEFE